MTDKIIDGQFRVVTGPQPKKIKPVDPEKLLMGISLAIVAVIVMAISAVSPVQRIAAWALHDRDPSHFSAWVDRAAYANGHWTVRPH